jgi:hypothetical protein
MKFPQDLAALFLIPTVALLLGLLMNLMLSNHVTH